MIKLWSETLEILVVRRYVGLLLVATVASAGVAQPKRQDGDHWIVTIPVAIEIKDDGRIEPQCIPFAMKLTTRDVNVTSLDQLAGMLPSSIPVFTTNTAGIRVQGIPARVSMDLGMMVSPQAPDAVYLDAQGQYAIYSSLLTPGSFEILPQVEQPMTEELAQIQADCANLPLPCCTLPVVYGPFPAPTVVVRGGSVASAAAHRAALITQDDAWIHVKDILGGGTGGVRWCCCGWLGGGPALLASDPGALYPWVYNAARAFAWTYCRHLRIECVPRCAFLRAVASRLSNCSSSWV